MKQKSKINIGDIDDPRDAIMASLKNEDRRLAWLVRQTGISYSHLYFTLKKKERPLTKENLSLINRVLGTSFKL